MSQAPSCELNPTPAFPQHAGVYRMEGVLCLIASLWGDIGSFFLPWRPRSAADAIIIRPSDSSVSKLEFEYLSWILNENRIYLVIGQPSFSEHRDDVGKDV